MWALPFHWCKAPWFALPVNLVSWVFPFYTILLLDLIVFLGLCMLLLLVLVPLNHGDLGKSTPMSEWSMRSWEGVLYEGFGFWISDFIIEWFDRTQIFFGSPPSFNLYGFFFFFSWPSFFWENLAVSILRDKW